MIIEISRKAEYLIKKTFKDKNVNNATIRMAISGYAWCGPTFGIVLDKQEESDLYIHYLIDEGIDYQTLIDEF